MNWLIGFLVLALGIFLSFPLQELIPPIAVFHGARVMVAPVLFAYGALAFPYPLMLTLAVFTGLLSDLAYLHVVGGVVEIGLGWSIVYYVLFGSLAHGFQPAFQKGHWWIHMPMSFLGTSLYLALQFVMITFRREGIYFGEVTAWRILAPGVMALLLSPLVPLIGWLAAPWMAGSPGMMPKRRYSGR